MLELEDIKKDAQVRGIKIGEIVRIVQVEAVGDAAITVYYKDSQGALSEQMLFRSDEARLDLAAEGKPWAFDAPGARAQKLAENSPFNRPYTCKGAIGGCVDDIRDVFLSIRLGIARAVSKIVPPHEVEDIVQETYVRLCQVGKPEQIQHPKSYLYRTARNLALDSLKRAENRVTEPWTEEFESSRDLAGLALDETYEQAASSEEFGHFCEAVRQLPVQARRVFVLKKVYGYSQREIASELRLAESTVEKHIALAVRRCAIYMQEQAWRESGEDNRKEVRGE